MLEPRRTSPNVLYVGDVVLRFGLPHRVSCVYPYPKWWAFR